MFRRKKIEMGEKGETINKYSYVDARVVLVQ